MSLKVSVTALCLVFSAGVASAGEWEKLGERTVRLVSERDEIPVSARKGKFDKIQIRVEGSAVEFNEVTVVLGTGSILNVPVRSVVPAGGKTREIDLPGEESVIRKVTFDYKTRQGATRRARVELWGKKD